MASTLEHRSPGGRGTAPSAAPSTAPTARDAKGYWRATLRLTVALLSIWFLVSYGAGILFREYLDQYQIGGAPLGFWFSQNGSIYVFVALIFVYCAQMTKYERRYGIGG